ncbi:LacI family DNA-binding transcriptional regulator [Gymnodinialimonas sp. 2305UL16-5]|uniref:LacI family DNA-binding transcriptional regulator n=1 Tax=Gymnodinialimonas mytili TaxID=3126503 RepID=UPI0030A87A9F
MDQSISDLKRTTLADVAARAGVSKMTASKVLRGTGSISAQTRERVRAAARDLSYVPNRLAGSLSSNRSHIVAVVLPSINDAVFGDVVSGINAVIRPEGYLTFIGESHFDTDLEDEIIQTVLSLQPAGMIVTGGIRRSERASQLLKSWPCPIIQIWDEQDAGYDGNIAPSHADAGRMIAQHFIEKGVRKPAYIGAELKKDLCAARRREAFKEVLTGVGLELIDCTDEDMPRQAGSGSKLIQDLMRQHPDIDALYCLNDAMALGALSWLHGAGFAVPDQIAVAGFNGTSFEHSVRTRLTTVHIERHALGQEAARAVLASIRGEVFAPREDFVATLVQGNTT